MIRKMIGWGLAQWFILSGGLKRKLKEYDGEGAILSLVGHDPTPVELEKILKWVIVVDKITHKSISFFCRP